MSSDEIELEGLSDLGLVLHHAVIGVQREARDEDRVGHRAPRMAAATRKRLHGLGDVVGAHDGGAVRDRQQVAGDRAADALVGRRRRNLNR